MSSTYAMYVPVGQIGKRQLAIKTWNSPSKINSVPSGDHCLFHVMEKRNENQAKGFFLPS